MIKIAGRVLVFFACVMLGLEKGRELSMHVKELEEFKRVFLMIRGELQYTRSTLSDVFLSVSPKVDGIYQTWLLELSRDLQMREHGNLEEVWKKSLQPIFRKCHLLKEEQMDLIQVGKSLSYPDTLELYLTRLDQSIERQKEEEKSKKKLYQSMGILGGIFLVMVLV